ncbi:ArsR/SmtB family transcription factor [Helicovermis profundi]|uniref:Metalloregulator ArsR/SmtB family transcription factor n=1 Tax=Helicovermis profundi TaxID=3065157 RepID=A0AAU9E8D7_9FIRM|nr:metalloregulator ArsR/SmtB family transcription factor [Clostridia bacterium S502]
MVEIFKTLGDLNRLRIINILIKVELCVCEIEVILDINQSNASRHLSKLKNNGFLDFSKDSLWTHYKVSKKFAKENEYLFKYIEKKLSENEIFTNDLKRLEKYKFNNLSCKKIAENREAVLNIIS